MYTAKREPKFAQLAYGQNLPTAFEGDLTMCTQLVAALKKGQFLPEYITLQEFECEGSTGCYHLCKHGIEHFAEGGKQMYKVEKVFGGDVFVK